MHRNKLGIFVKCPAPGRVKTRLTPPLTPDQGCELYRACIADLSRRVARASKYAIRVFYDGDDLSSLDGLLPERATLERQRGDTLGERLITAFSSLLSEKSPGPAVIIGSDSPDLPLLSLKRAFQKLKHRDVVLGPTVDGGYYLVGLRRPLPALFMDIPWSDEQVFSKTLDVIEREGLKLATLPLWYDVDSEQELRTLRESVRARRIERRDRLTALEFALAKIDR